MSNRAITINQAYQPKPQTTKNKDLKRPAQIFPDVTTSQTGQINPLKSITTILTQALSTRDQQSIKQLLVTASPQIIDNTVEQLQISKLLALMSAIQIILIEECRNRTYVEIVSIWLMQLLKKNIGHIINNPQLQIISARISRIIKKKVSLLPKLQTLKTNINNCQPQQEDKTKQLIFTPKFHYIQQQHQIIHNKNQQQKEQNKQNGDDNEDEIRPEDLEEFDAMFMDDEY